MSPIEHFDILVVSGGNLGTTLAMDQARAGRRVAPAEAGMTCGSCINIACIPSTALSRSADFGRIIARATKD